MCITILCCPGRDVTKFKINLLFLIKPFCYITKNSGQKLKYLENKKAFFIIPKGLSAAKNCLRPESAPLNSNLKSYRTNQMR